MKHRDYVAEREARDPEFRREREKTKSRNQFRIALVRARLSAGLTQAELAEELGMKQSAVARLESGMSNPTLEMIVRLAKALSVTFEIRSDGKVEAYESSATT